MTIRIDTFHAHAPSYLTARFGEFTDVLAVDLHGSRDCSIAVSGLIPHGMPVFSCALVDRPASVDWHEFSSWQAGPYRGDASFDSPQSRLFRLPASARWIRVRLDEYQSGMRPDPADIRSPGFQTLKISIRSADKPLRYVVNTGTEPSPVQTATVRLQHIGTTGPLPRQVNLDLRTLFENVDSLSYYALQVPDSVDTFSVIMLDSVTARISQRRDTRGPDQHFTVQVIDAVGRMTSNDVHVHVTRGGS